jgi:hypothetical protein
MRKDTELIFHCFAWGNKTASGTLIPGAVAFGGVGFGLRPFSCYKQSLCSGEQWSARNLAAEGVRRNDPAKTYYTAKKQLAVARITARRVRISHALAGVVIVLLCVVIFMLWRLDAYLHFVLQH